jgi:hypothetical protein
MSGSARPIVPPVLPMQGSFLHVKELAGIIHATRKTDDTVSIEA